MKKLLAILISLCMVSAFAVPVFADANSDYIAAVKAYQAQIAAKEAGQGKNDSGMATQQWVKQRLRLLQLFHRSPGTEESSGCQ